MSNIELLTNDLRQMELDYIPLGEVRDALQQKEIVMVIGPFAVGKTAVMDRAQEIDSDFRIAKGFTTRSRRPEEDTQSYDFLPYNEASLSHIQTQARSGELVQFAVHPTTSHIYGSDLSGYKTPFSLISVVVPAVASIEALPFKQTHKVAITVPPLVWLERFEERLGDSNHKEIEARLQEGVSNIEWSLDQGDMAWIVNGRRDITDSAAQLVGIAKGYESPSADGRKVASQLRAQIQDLLNA